MYREQISTKSLVGSISGGNHIVCLPYSQAGVGRALDHKLEIQILLLAWPPEHCSNLSFHLFDLVFSLEIYRIALSNPCGPIPMILWEGMKCRASLKRYVSQVIHK
jgi:hypothetical protein